MDTIKKIQKKAWYTCTPVSFDGDISFFKRDSGLLSRGFQELGYESRSIMPNPARENDLPELIRTDYQNLEDSEWWKSLKIDGLVFYSWGDPKYTSIARAIREAGIILVVHLDTTGFISPVLGYARYLQMIRDIYPGRGVSLCYHLCKCCFIPIFDLKRIKHLEYANWICALTPIAKKHLHDYFEFYRRPEVSSRLIVAGHGVNPRMKYYEGKDSTRNQIIVVGRWHAADDWQKNTDLVISTIVDFLLNDSRYNALIVGSGALQLNDFYKNELHEVKSRVELIDWVSNDELVDKYNESQVALCASRHESFHIASAEALCCGCTIVSYIADSMSSMQYFAGDGRFGTLADEGTSEALAEALREETTLWQNGERNPVEISTFWTNELHGSNVAKSLLDQIS